MNKVVKKKKVCIKGMTYLKPKSWTDKKSKCMDEKQ